MNAVNVQLRRDSFPSTVQATPPAAIDHACLGVNTQPGSAPYNIDDVLLRNVGKPLTVEAIAAASGETKQRVKVHVLYWMGLTAKGQPQEIGKNNWTAKRVASELHRRLTCNAAGYFLKD